MFQQVEGLVDDVNDFGVSEKLHTKEPKVIILWTGDPATSRTIGESCRQFAADPTGVASPLSMDCANCGVPYSLHTATLLSVSEYDRKNPH